MRSRPFCWLRDGLILPARLLPDLRFIGGSALRGILSETTSDEDRPRDSLLTAVTVWLGVRSSTFPVDKGGVSTPLEQGLECEYNIWSSANADPDVDIGMCDVTMAPIPAPIATAVEVWLNAVDASPTVHETISVMVGFPPSAVKGVLPIVKDVSSSCFFMHAALGFKFLSGKETRWGSGK